MPTVLELFGLKFLIFTAEHQPPHVHVKSSNGSAKFIIWEEVKLVSSTLKPKELKLAEYILEENIDTYLMNGRKFTGSYNPRE